jgi:hypothetical protein
MRKYFVLLTLLAFVAASTMVFAVDPSAEKQDEPKIKCCLQDGQCLETKKDNCALKKGTVVQDCKQCSGAKGK